MAAAYTKDQIVEQPAIRLFAELGWQTVAALGEVFGSGGTLGRETPGEAAVRAGFRAELGYRFAPIRVWRGKGSE
jgi:type I restriction enzyme R subunit